MAHVTYATNTDGDWAALYVDGRLAPDVPQTHSLSIKDVLDALVGKTIQCATYLEADMEEGMADWLGPDGFPEYLSQIPQEARS